MNKSFKQLLTWIKIGNEIEFTYKGKRYSITYGKNDANKEYISLCEFYQQDTEFYSIEEFSKCAHIQSELLCDIWTKVTNIDVF